MNAWHEQDTFWNKWAPVMFHERRWEKAQEEVANIISLLNISETASVLDLCCGPGRHSLQLAQQGFSVTAVDRTKMYLERARKQAETEGLKIEFIEDDMNDDRQVAANVYRSLKDKGVFLIDIMGKEVLARIFRERDWYELDNIMVLEERKVCANWSWIENRWLMIKDGKMDEWKVSHRLYSAAELAALLSDCGFKAIDVYGDLTGTPYDHTAKRLVLVAHKGKGET